MVMSLPGAVSGWLVRWRLVAMVMSMLNSRRRSSSSTVFSSVKFTGN